MSGDLVEHNRDYFDKLATTYDRGPVEKVASAAAEIILQSYVFDTANTRVLDFACGTGLVSKSLAPGCKEVVGVDISQKMVDIYNAKAQGSDEMKGKLKAMIIDPDDPDIGLGSTQFDVVVCSQAYHHIPDPKEITRRLAARLVPGTGTLFVIDWVRSADSIDMFEQFTKHHHMPANAAHTHSHPGGFLEAEMKDFYDAAGLVEFTFTRFPGYQLGSITREMFVSKGVQPQA